MEKVSLRAVLGKSWTSFLENWWAWLGLFVPVIFTASLINLGVTWLKITNPELEDMFTILSFPTLLLVIFGSFSLVKYSLTLVRQPELVKANFFQAIWYSLRDGFGRRLLYAFFVFLMLIGFGIIVYFLILFISYSSLSRPGLGGYTTFLYALAYLGWQGEPVLYFLVFFVLSWVIALLINLIFAPFVLFPYIVQDTLSDDNQGYYLSFFACFRKSFQLMKGYKLRYAVLFTVIGALTYYLDNAVLNTLANDLFGLIIAFLLTTLTTVPAFIISAVWADEMMANDDEIVDYGDY